MYNRYISQPDGSFEKQKITEGTEKTVPPTHVPRQEAKNEEKQNMLPFNMDSSDMLVFIMLLLINGGGDGNEYNPLLTLVFYLFL